VPFTVTPRGRQEVRVRLALPPISDCARARGGEQLAIPLQVRFAGPAGDIQSQSWELRCVVRPVLQAACQQALGMQTAGQFASGREIELTAAEHVEAVDCEAPAHWAVTVRRAAGGAPKFVAALRFVGPPTPATINDTIVFIPTDAEGRQSSRVSVQITGELVEDVVASPRSAYFGRYAIGSVVEEAVVLNSLTGRPFTIREALSRMAGCTAERVENESSDSVWLIRQKVAAVGQQSGEVEFVVEDDAGSVIRLRVPVTYLGVER
jgi:hypothetical protein